MLDPDRPGDQPALQATGNTPVVAACELLLRSYRYTEDEAWGWPGGRYSGWTTAFLLLRSEDGTEGLGEIGDGLNVPSVLPAVVDWMGSRIRGLPAEPRSIVSAVESLGPGWTQGGLLASVISGLEIATVDLLAKSFGVPAHVVVGGALRKTVGAYASAGLTLDPTDLQAELVSYVAAGYRAVKIRIGHGLDLDVERTAAAREVLGDGVALMVDYGASYLPERPSLGYLMLLCERLEEFDLLWLEDPLPSWDVSGLARLRSAVRVPIAAGETIRSMAEVFRLLDAGAVDVLQTDCVYVGGILRQIEIGQLAARAGVRLAPHSWGAGPGLMANATAVACSSAGFLVEVPQVRNPLRDESLAEPLRLSEGRLVLPEQPGLGVLLTPKLRTGTFDAEAVPALYGSASTREGMDAARQG